MMHEKNVNINKSFNSKKNKVASQVSIERNAVFLLLKQLSIDNQVYFERVYSTSLYAKRIADCCREISISSGLLTDLIKNIQDISQKCDYDEKTPGNGFRSLICVCDETVLRLISVLRICSENRGFIMFRMSHYCKELESMGAILRFLILTFHQVISLFDSLDENSLFPPLDSDYEQYNGILRCIESLDASCFYGRPLGFQFCPSVTRIFQIIGIVLATYSLTWETRFSAIGSLIHSGKLLLNPEERAVRIIKVTREADIEFCRGFWNLSEIPMPKLFCPAMAICENREIPLVGPMPLEMINGEFVHIPEPSAHTGPRPVQIKVISLIHRIGLSNSATSNKHSLSPYLVIHCHGGGYVATSSKSHETYLRSWAKALNCPLVSIDYSLAPENPFPRPTEEVLYAYAWILNHPNNLGWSGEKVCMVGDSAGGNLIVSLCLRLIELNVKRIPDGIVPIYTPFLFQYLPSPSRVLSFMDPLLHMGVIIRCAAAYTGDYKDNNPDNDCGTNKNVKSSRKSLVEYVNQVQKAQHDQILNFNDDSQSIVSLINLSQEKQKNFFSTLFNNSNSEDNLASTSTSKSIKKTKCKSNSNFDVLSKEVMVNEEINEQIENDVINNSHQAVEVNGNPLHICLSSTNLDESLLNYLHHHPITKSFIQPELQNNNFSSYIKDKDSNDNMLSFNEFEEDLDDNVFSTQTTAVNTANLATLSKSQTVNSINNFLTSTIRRKCSGNGDSNSSTITPRNSSSRFPLLSNVSTHSSAGRTPVFPIKKKLTKYRGLSQSLADTAALAAGHAYDNISDWFDTPKTPIGHIDKKKLTRAANLSSQAAAQVHLAESQTHNSNLTELMKLKLPRNYLISPMYAPPELLRKLPSIHFVACHLDPLLDDTIMFARKVRDSGGRVLNVKILDSLPHGFLNFAPMSTDCAEGANLCLHLIRQVLTL